MSTFSGFVSEFPDIRIDRFREPALAYFLSHVHSDHLLGLEACRSPFIYCSSATREILLRLEKRAHRINFAQGILEERKRTYHHLKTLLKPLPLDTPIDIELQPGRSIRVTLLDANHCPGAVMFMIEGEGKTVLYTGDVRSEPWWLTALCRHPLILPYVHHDGEASLKRFDTIYLDTSFASKDDMYKEFPPKSQGMHELLTRVSTYPKDTIFYFDSWTFGYEDVWQALSAFLDERIHVDDYRYGLYEALWQATGPKAHEAFTLIGTPFANRFQFGCLTKDPAARLHSCERGTGCSVWDGKFVRITPIIARHNGEDILELGAGGGHGDLNQQHELMVEDASTISKLFQLCQTKLQDRPELLAKIERMLNPAMIIGQTIALNPELLAPAGPSSSQLNQHDVHEIATIDDLIKNLISAGSDAVPHDQSTVASSGINGLSSRITFPYSRHSSYNELAGLIKAFLPRNIYPCTVDERDWTPSRSMAYLFGHLYNRGVVFSYDQVMLVKYHRMKAKISRTDKQSARESGSNTAAKANTLESSERGPNLTRSKQFDPSAPEHTERSLKRIRRHESSSTAHREPPSTPDRNVTPTTHLTDNAPSETSDHEPPPDIVCERDVSGVQTPGRQTDSAVRSALQHEAYNAALGVNDASWWDIGLVSVDRLRRANDEKQL